MTKVFLVFVISFACGWIGIELAAWLNGSGFHASRGIVVGFVYAFFWTLAHKAIVKNIYRAALIGSLMPAITCAATVVGIGFLMTIAYYWYVFFPIGGLNGVIVFALEEKDRQSHVNSV